METTPRDPQPERVPAHPGRIGGGAVLIAMGVVMLLDRSNLVRGNVWQAFPGLILVMFGVLNMMTAFRTCDGHKSSPFGGLWLIFIGSWLIGNGMHIYGMTYAHSWPLLIIAGGTVIVLRELFPDRERRRERN